MTVSSLTLRGKVAGPKAIAATQPIGFPIMATSELEIIEVVDASGVETPMVLGVNYSVALTGDPPSDGTITFLTALATGSTWYYVRRVVLDQQNNWVTADKFPSDSHERAADKVTLALQDIEDRAKRAVHAPVQDEAQVMVLPRKADRLGKYLQFDGTTGLPSAVTEVTPGSIAFTALGQALVEAATAAAMRGAAILDCLENLYTTQGDMLFRDGSGEARLPIGLAGEILKVVAGQPSWQPETAQTLPRSYLAGLGLSNGADFDHDIVIQPGECRDSTDAEDMALAATLTKQIDFPWAAGTAAGGLFSGAAALGVNLWYHVFLIRKTSDGSIDAGFDDNISCSNIPPGYSEFRRIGSIQMKSATPDIKQFIQDGDYFEWKSPVVEVDIAGTGTAAVLSAALSTPLGLRSRVLLNVASFDGAGGAAYIFDPQLTAINPSMSVAPLCSHQVDPTGTRDAEQVWSRTDDASKVMLDWDADFDNFRMATVAYIDRRGKDD